MIRMRLLPFLVFWFLFTRIALGGDLLAELVNVKIPATTFEELLTLPPDDRTEWIKAEEAEINESLGKFLQVLREQVPGLEQEYLVERERGLNFATIMEQVSNPQASGEQLLEMAKRLQHWEGRLDAVNQIKLNYFIERYYHTLRLGMAGVWEQFSPEVRQTLLEKMKPIEENYVEYQKFRKKFGALLGDFNRIKAYKKFFSALGEFEAALDQMNDKEWQLEARTLKGKLQRFKELSRRDLGILKRAPKIVEPYLRLKNLMESYEPTMEPRRGDERGDMNLLLREYGAAQGFRPKVEGGSVITDLQRQKDVFVVYAATHRSGTLDVISLAHLPIENSVTMMAALQQLPKKLLDQLELSPDVIMLRSARDRIDPQWGGLDQELVKAYRNGKRALVVFPEGIVHEGFGHTNPVRRNFIKTLVQPVVDAGYPVAVVPIALDGNETYLTQEKTFDREMTVRVGRPIMPEVVKSLAADENTKPILDSLIRLSWLENLSNNREKVFGQMRIDQAGEILWNAFPKVRGWCGTAVSLY